MTRKYQVSTWFSAVNPPGVSGALSPKACGRLQPHVQPRRDLRLPIHRAGAENAVNSVSSASLR
jgi:hypothetical protein